MRIGIVYIFPALQFVKYMPLAKRFADTYLAHPPGESPHDLYVVSNGEPIQVHHKNLFGPLPVTHLTHNNFGKDIGAFQMAAEAIQCDLLVCFGAHIFFWKPGWLDRMVNAYLDHGPALYGAWAFHQPAHHIRTTALWMPPELLRSYPFTVGNPQRYEFEHGRHSIVEHARSMGFPSKMVTWRGVYDEKDWHHVERADCLYLDQHCESIGYK